MANNPTAPARHSSPRSLRPLGRSKEVVYVEDDGSVRELTDDEKEYVDTKFSPFDSARPYFKAHYEDRLPDGSIRGFLHRDEVPDGMPIKLTPK